MEYFYSADPETKRRVSKKLRELLQRREGILPTIVIGEIVHSVCERVGKEEAEACYFALVRSGLQVQSLSEDIARQAGLLRCQYGNIPTGDCIIAATALVNKAKILSDDPHFDAVKETKRTWI